jgi:ABC-type Na+ efflux pump permease subunit
MKKPSILGLTGILVFLVGLGLLEDLPEIFGVNIQPINFTIMVIGLVLLLLGLVTGK